MAALSKLKKKNKIKSTSERMRLSVFRSNKNIFAQIIDDEKGLTLVSASSLKMPRKSGMELAKDVGRMLSELARSKSISKVVFDRGLYQYKGRVRALADSAREFGLDF